MNKTEKTKEAKYLNVNLTVKTRKEAVIFFFTNGCYLINRLRYNTIVWVKISHRIGEITVTTESFKLFKVIPW